jgi:hypothetical protein
MSFGEAARISALLAAACLPASLFVRPACATELKPETISAFDHYIQLVEARMGDDLRDGNFLYIDQLPADRRAKIFAQIRGGEPYIEPVPVLENGNPFNTPAGLIHHWIGISFIPGATYSQTLAVLLDFDKQAAIYKPDVRQSRLLETHGNRSKVFLQYYRKSLVTAVLDANFDAEYLPLGDTRGEIRSNSTRIAEVQNFGQPNEKELPVGRDHGYLWRLNSYWRIEEKDGGVYLQIESVALSRPVSAVIAWLIDPVVRSLSRAVLRNLLAGTCRAVNSSNPSGKSVTGNDAQGCALQPGFR